MHIYSDCNVIFYLKSNDMLFLWFRCKIYPKQQLAEHKSDTKQLYLLLKTVVPNDCKATEHNSYEVRRTGLCMDMGEAFKLSPTKRFLKTSIYISEISLFML